MSLRRALVGFGMALTAPPAGATARSCAGGRLESEQHRGENGGGGKPLDVAFGHAGDLNADVSGGRSRGPAHLGRASVLFDADLDMLIGSAT